MQAIHEPIANLVDENSQNETEILDENKVSNGLENFSLEEDTPELFNSDTNEEVLTTSDEVNSPDEEDLEIPAFLRRQKN